jgi:hypothetical protein
MTGTPAPGNPPTRVPADLGLAPLAVLGPLLEPGVPPQQVRDLRRPREAGPAGDRVARAVAGAARARPTRARPPRYPRRAPTARKPRSRRACARAGRRRPVPERSAEVVHQQRGTAPGPAAPPPRARRPGASAGAQRRLSPPTRAQSGHAGRYARADLAVDGRKRARARPVRAGVRGQRAARGPRRPAKTRPPGPGMWSSPWRNREPMPGADGAAVGLPAPTLLRDVGWLGPTPSKGSARPEAAWRGFRPQCAARARRRLHGVGRGFRPPRAVACNAARGAHAHRRAGQAAGAGPCSAHGADRRPRRSRKGARPAKMASRRSSWTSGGRASSPAASPPAKRAGGGPSRRCRCPSKRSRVAVRSLLAGFGGFSSA